MYDPVMFDNARVVQSIKYDVHSRNTQFLEIRYVWDWNEYRKKNRKISWHRE